MIKKDIKSNYIVIGDSNGNLRLYDIRGGVSVCDDAEAIKLSFKEVVLKLKY